MNAQELIEYCLIKPGAYLDCPFGPEPICARIGGRIFAEIYLNRPWVTFKCEPMYGLALRQAYPEEIRRGYHCPTPQHPYNNTVTLNGTVPIETLYQMVDHSYARALASLPKNKREAAINRIPESSALGELKV